ncbi:MBL fold metallo-hydrolase [Solilutibacter silvestris]|uniref:Metallo-beta-lactamase superfamily n=1 Tax=Solilutibacter silvestris TaxID=1645665 RepID=A0A2K1Q1L7_9GAMM|nr:MBL fold metallo-hydrolase [Lysobacter silvestris]PNS08939.1 Metallo-beta-lactamase superfamily [Lysobacter silvestris]
MSFALLPRVARSMALALACCLPFTQSAAAQTAAIPMPSRQAPGYYHQAIGSLRVTALFDGMVYLPLSDLHGITPTKARALLHDEYVPETAKGLQTSVNAYLIRNDKQLTLVDTGAQACFGPGLGQVLDNLKLAGYAPEQVSDILITHAHPDHLCGILDAQGKPAYPNANVWLAREDGDYWLDPAKEKDPTVPAFFRPLFAMARNAVAPYQAAGKLHLFGAGDRLPGGAQLVVAHGHTPGHSAYLFDGGHGQKLLVWGDSLHYHAIQFRHPEVSYAGDANDARAIDSRRHLLQQIVSGRWRVAAAHMPFPGLGHVRRDGNAYAWIPAEYSPLPQDGR